MPLGIILTYSFQERNKGYSSTQGYMKWNITAN